jgi:hypothetical protein
MLDFRAFLSLLLLLFQIHHFPFVFASSQCFPCKTHTDHIHRFCLSLVTLFCQQSSIYESRKGEKRAPILSAENTITALLWLLFIIS